MNPTEEQLETQRQRIRNEIQALFQSNEEIWRAMVVARSVSRSGGLQQLIHNSTELAKLGEEERRILLELLALEKSS
jgi:hypothetical protein